MLHSASNVGCLEEGPGSFVLWNAGRGLRIRGGRVDNPVGLMFYVVETLAGETLQKIETPSSEFTRFVKEAEPRLSYAFFAAYGPEVGADVTSESLAYGWEHWNEIRDMENPSGYLFRVGQSKARWYHKSRTCFPSIARSSIPEVEPRLPEALDHLTRNQRIAVVLVYAMDWTEDEVARLIGRSRSTVRTHLERGLRRLQDELGVKSHA